MEFFKDKVVVVTGGSDGIGKALVEQLLLSKAKVATCGRGIDKLHQLAISFVQYPLFFKIADLSKESECKLFIETVLEHYQKIDILINNAGISMKAVFNETSIDTLHKLMDINFWGAVNCTKFALPAILKSTGIIVGISSIAGYRGLPGRTGYCASKFALQGFLESLKTELLQTNVHVMWVAPGFTKSNIRKVALNKDAISTSEKNIDENNLMSADECAKKILISIEQKKRTLILTKQGKITYWLNKLIPSLADKLIYKYYYKNDILVK